MNVVITDWALQSYLQIKARNIFTVKDYKTIIRPDAERLKVFPTDPKFRLRSFWGPATRGNGVNVQDGYKMKWDSIGPGRVELRLGVAIVGGAAYLCQAYVKDDKRDRRECLNLERYVNLIRQGRFISRGQI